MSYKVCRIEVLTGAVTVVPANSVGFVNGATVTESGDEIDVTVGNPTCSKSYLTGPIETAITLNMFSRHLPSTDPASAVDSGQASLVAGAKVSLALRPDGSGSGKPQLQWLDVSIISREFAGVVDGSWTWNIEARANGAADETAQT